MLLSNKLRQVALGQIPRLLVCMPPRHGKSTLTSHYFPAWYLGRFPERQVILASYQAGFAGTWGRRVRDTLKELGPFAFGVQLAPGYTAGDQWRLRRVGQTRVLGGMQTAGAGGSITGKGADLLLIDDPIKNDLEARSPRIRQRIWDWYQTTAYTRLEPAGGVVLVMTRWHRHDLAGRLLEQAQTHGEHWETVILPARAREDDPLGRAVDAPLWPERFSAERLEAIRQTVGPDHFASLYQQHPRPDGGAEWPSSYFPPELWFDDWPTVLPLRVMALDPSKGRDARSGDYSAIVQLGVCEAGRLWIAADLARRPVTRMLEDALALAARWKPQAFAVEANQFQELLVDELHRLAAARGMMALPLVPLENRLPKAVRIRTLGPLLAQGGLRFHAASPGTRLLVEQLEDFPLGAHDDGPDALEMAIRTAQQLLGDAQQAADDELDGSWLGRF